MDELIAILVAHGYLVLFAMVFLDQLGVPVPALPIVVAAGALAGAGQLDPFLATLVVVLGTLPADWLWYELGRRQGTRVVRVLCRISLEPDSCVRSTQNFFVRHGPRSLLVAKWVPGLQTVAPPLAGASRMERLPFLAYAVAGGAIWGGVLVGVGYALRDQLGIIGRMLGELGGFAIVLLGGGLAFYVGFKFIQRQRFIRTLRAARISPEELEMRISANEPIEIIDLRHAIDFESDPFLIPGARRFSPEALETRGDEIPRDREIVLYCT